MTVTAGQRHDAIYRSVPLLPYGAPVYATAAGSATSDTTVWVEPPHGRLLEGPALSILVGPTVEAQSARRCCPPPPCQAEVGRYASDLETATSDLMAAISLQRLFSGGNRPPQAEELDARIRAAIAMLVARQGREGGWSWAGAGERCERFATARAVWALGLARKEAYRVPEAEFHQAVGWLQDQLTAAAKDNFETKALLLHTLATIDKANFALANRLHRERQRLSAGELAYLARRWPRWTARRWPRKFSTAGPPHAPSPGKFTPRMACCGAARAIWIPPPAQPRAKRRQGAGSPAEIAAVWAWPSRRPSRSRAS